MMTPMENIGDSPSPEDGRPQQVDMRPDPASGQPSTDQMEAAGGPNWRSTLLTCCSRSGTSRNKVEPVIFKPLNDVYLQLKPKRRLRVIHINSHGSLPNPRPYFYNNDDGNSSSDEDYWFKNADPKRPKIEAVRHNEPPTRIFHKFEPQVRPNVESLTSRAAATSSSSAGRLRRKTIKDVVDSDSDDESPQETDENLNQSMPDGAKDCPAAINSRSESPEPDTKVVLTLPEPGETCTDDNNVDNHAIASPGIGGLTNVGFESEEFEAEDKVDTSPNVTSSSHQVNSECVAVVLPALFFIHGVGGSADVWRNQLVYFSELGHEVIAPDLLGHGFSSAPDKAKSYTFVKLLRDTVTIFDHFVPRNRQCVLVSHSYGASLAVALARSRPDNVRLLIMCASGGPTPIAPPRHLAKVSPWLLACLKPVFKSRFGAKSDKYATGPKGKSIKVKEAFDVPAYVLHHTLMGQHWPEGDSAYHRRIAIPTLLVYGMKDTLVSLVEMCEMERTIPKSYLELIPLAGHMVMQDQPEQLNVMMKKFVTHYCS